MTKDSSLSIRVGSELKGQAEKVLNALGLNLTTAVNMLLQQVVREQALPLTLALKTTEENPDPVANFPPQQGAGGSSHSPVVATLPARPGKVKVKPQKTTPLLAGETVIVSGASRGIGAAIARHFAENGGQVLINYQHSKKAAEDLCFGLRRAGYTADIFAADIAQEREVEALFAFAEKKWGQAVSVLVNNAGADLRKLVTETTAADFDHIIAVNLKGPFLCCRRALPGMLRQNRGCIINIGSVFGTTGAAFEAVYAATKGALANFTLSLAAEAGPGGVRANLIAPGAIATDMLHSELDPEELAALRQEIPLGRLGTPDDVAAACVFLASPAASYISGQILQVNGGWLNR